MKMKLTPALVITAVSFSLLFSNHLFAKELKFNVTDKIQTNEKFNRVNFEKFFEGVDGCAVFYSVKNNTYDVYNKEMLNVREIPCSTFKIISSLAGLKYGIIQDENTILKWDGSKQIMKEWEQDLSLKSAFKLSTNWYFDHIDKQVGLDNINNILKEINYGNLSLTDNAPIGESTLKISPMEQLDLIKRLFNNELPFDKEHIKIVRNIMLTSNEKGELYGKTGTSGPFFLEDGAQTAWFIGDYKTKEDEFYFAVRIYGDKNNKNITGPYTQTIAKNICEEIYYK